MGRIVAYTLKQLAENPKLWDEIEKWREKNAQRCSNDQCRVRLSGTLTGRNVTPSGTFCDDCFYEAMGKFVEENPIGPAPRRRG